MAALGNRPFALTAVLTTRCGCQREVPLDHMPVELHIPLRTRIRLYGKPERTDLPLETRTFIFIRREGRRVFYEECEP